jgi:hypothetical protein
MIDAKPHDSPVAAAGSFAEQPADKPKDGDVRRVGRKSKSIKPLPKKRGGLNSTIYIRDKLPWKLPKF